MLPRIAGWLLIRPGEGGMLAYLAGLNLLLGLGMALGRTSSDALFFKRFGVQYLPLMLFVTSILLVLFSMLYAAYADRIRPGRIFNVMFAACGVYLLAIWAAMRWEAGDLAYALYFLGYGVMSEMLLSHFTLYALGYMDGLQAKRLLPVVSAAARLGAVAGGVTVGLSGAFLAVEDLAFAWVVMLALSFLVVSRGRRGEPTAAVCARRGRSPLTDIQEGLRFAKRSRLMQVTSIGVFVMIVLVSIQDYLASTILTRHFDDAQSLAAFFGWFFAVTNGIVLLVQLFATNRLLRRFGLSAVNLIFPWSTVVVLGTLSLSASFVPALLARFNYVGLLHAFRNPAANLFYTALPGYMQGRARALVMGLILPMGLACSGLMLMLVPKAAVDERLALAGLGLALFYLYLKTRKNRLYSDSMMEVIRQQVFAGRQVALEGEGLFTDALADEVERLMRQTGDEDAVLALADLLATHRPERAGLVLMEIAARFSAATQDRLLRRIAHLRPEGWQDHARACLGQQELHLRATALGLLAAAGDSAAAQVARDWMAAASPRLAAAGAQVALHAGDGALACLGQATLQGLLRDPRPEPALSALAAIRARGERALLPAARARLEDGDARVRAAAVACCAQLAAARGEDGREWLQTAWRDASPRVRAAAIAALPCVADETLRLEILAEAMDDRDPLVRRAITEHAGDSLPADEAGLRRGFATYRGHFAMRRLLTQGLPRWGGASWRELAVEVAREHLHAAREARVVLLALARLPAATRGMAGPLLRTVLQEEVGRHVDCVLEVMDLLDEGEGVRTARAALASRDRRLRAQAIESVRHLEHAALFADLMPLLEDDAPTPPLKSFAGPPQERLGPHGGRLGWFSRVGGTASPAAMPVTWEEILDWCARHGSRWLAQCAQQLADARL